ATYGVGPGTRLRASAGLYAQSPGYEKLIVSHYVVARVALLDFEKARHFSLGLEQDLPQGLSARIEAYHKRFEHLVVGRLETEAERRLRIRRQDSPSELQSVT